MKIEDMIEIIVNCLDAVKEIMQDPSFTEAAKERYGAEIDLPDSVPGMTVKAPELPKVEIPEDWDI